MSMPSIDPADYRAGELSEPTTPLSPTPTFIPAPLRCHCGSTDIRVDAEAPMAVCGACGTVGMRDEFRKDCAVCEEEFATAKKIHGRRAKGHDVCIQCAIDNGLTLDPDDSNELAEHYWAGRDSQADGGSYYSSERMEAARRID